MATIDIIYHPDEDESDSDGTSAIVYTQSDHLPTVLPSFELTNQPLYYLACDVTRLATNTIWLQIPL
jgi:hypothetical protein